MKRVLPFLLVLVFAASSPALADSHAAQGAHPDEDHWSILTHVLPATLAQNVKHLLGPTTFMEHQPVSKLAHVVMAALVMVLLLLGGLVVRARLSGKNAENYVVPTGRFDLVVFFEAVVDAAYGMMVDMMGEKHARRYFPLVGGLAFFILLSNLLGSIPGFLPPTDNWNTTLALGLVVFLAYNYYGVREHGLGYLKHFFGPIQVWYALPLMIFMFFIEVVGHVVRPMSLSIRLMGNIFGDHTVLAIFLAFHIIFLPIPLQILGLLVAVVQTFVFCLLSTAYIAMAVAEEEH
jgi:F-type H+-transporting ATPase subunit a